MDDRGRLAQSVTRQAPRRRPAAASRVLVSRLWRRFALPLSRVRMPRHAGAFACLAFLLGAGLYGIVRGEHVATISTLIKDTADSAANSAGMRIAEVSLSGQRQVSREEIFAAAGVTANSSLLFLDVAEAREKLEAIPWIAEATVRKLYPDRLQITVTEREAFALWQLNGKVSVIAADGTPLSAKVEPRLATLPRRRASSLPSLIATLPSVIRCAPRSSSASGAGTCGSRAESMFVCRRPTSKWH
jgi:cell division protein FtsQ